MADKHLLHHYSHESDTSSLDFEFTDDSFLAELRPWRSLINVR